MNYDKDVKVLMTAIPNILTPTAWKAAMSQCQLTWTTGIKCQKQIPDQLSICFWQLANFELFRRNSKLTGYLIFVHM